MTPYDYIQNLRRKKKTIFKICDLKLTLNIYIAIKYFIKSKKEF